MSTARAEWEAEMAHHEKMEAEFFERVRTGRQADFEPEATRAYWRSRQEVWICDVHGERPVSVRHCPQCDGSLKSCERDGCNKPVRSKRADARYCSAACKQAAHRQLRVTDN